MKLKTTFVRAAQTDKRRRELRFRPRRGIGTATER
jgi:hypothetical protein